MVAPLVWSSYFGPFSGLRDQSKETTEKGPCSLLDRIPRPLQPQVGLYAVAPAGLEFEVKDTVVTVVDLPSNQIAERAAAESDDEPIKAAFGLSLIDRVDIVGQPEGTRYMVFPTVLGRAMQSPIPETTGWNEAQSKGVADTGSLHNQSVCHPLSQVARVKPSWNLEDWRPDVGLPRTIAE